MKTQPLPTSRWVTAALAPLLLFAGSQAMASHPPPEVGDCYFQKFGEVPGGGPITANQYCTADDVELGIVNAIILDGCDDENDTLKLTFQGQLIANSQTRYDPAFSININGNIDLISNQLPADAAVTDTVQDACLTQYLTAAVPTPPGTGADISSGHGPWKGLDQYKIPNTTTWVGPPAGTDACGDAVQNDDNRIDVGDPFVDPIVLSCGGYDPASSTFAVAYLVSWDNSVKNDEGVVAGKIGPNGNQLCPEDPTGVACTYEACDTLDEAHFTEQSSKCRVGVQRTDATRPNIKVTKRCDVTKVSDVKVPAGTVVGPGGEIHCTITVTNLPPTTPAGVTPGWATYRHVVDDFSEEVLASVGNFVGTQYAPDGTGVIMADIDPNGVTGNVTFGDTGPSYAPPNVDIQGVLDPTQGAGDYGALIGATTTGTIPDDLPGTFIWAINGGGYNCPQVGQPGDPGYIPRGCNVQPMTGQEKYTLEFDMKVKSLAELEAMGWDPVTGVDACNVVYDARNNTYDMLNICTGSPTGDLAQQCQALTAAGEIADFKINYWLDNISAKLLADAGYGTPPAPTPDNVANDPYYRLLRGELQGPAIAARLYDINGYEVISGNSCYLVTPANVVGMSAVADGDGIALQWQTESESGTAGFYVERQDPGSDEWQRLNDEMLPVNIESLAGSTYQFSDGEATSKGLYRYSYRLIEVEQDGNTLIHGPYNLTVGQGANAIGDDADMTAAGGKLKAKGNPPSQKMQQRFKARDQELKSRGLDNKKDNKVGGKDDLSAVLPESGGRGILPQLVNAVLDFLVPSAHAARKVKPPVEEPPAPAAAADRIKIGVQQEGLYYVSAGDIANTLGMKTRDVKNKIADGGFALSNRGEPVAWVAAGGNSGLSFYGEALQEPESTFTNDNVYWLESAGGSLMSTASAAPSGSGDPSATFVATIDAEVDAFASLAMAKQPGDDFWFWNFIAPAGSASEYGALSQSYTFDASGASGAGQVVITPRLHGWYSADDNHVTVELNGVAVGDIRWLGGGAHSESLVVELGSGGFNLFETGNTLTIKPKLDEGASFAYVLVDGFEVGYESRYVADGNSASFSGADDATVTVSGFDSGDIRVFNISDAKQPKLLEGIEIAQGASGFEVTLSPADGADYFATTGDGTIPATIAANARVDLQASAGNAEYIVVTSEDLRDAAQGFADLRGGMLATFEEVVNEYNHGISSPFAIKNFIEAAYNASEKTKAVFLVGYGHYDYRGDNNLVPPLLVGGAYNGAPADNLYGTLNGELKIAVGRLPALTSQEVSDYLDKVVGYESRSPSADGKRTLLWSAGPPDTQNATAYDAGDFTASSEEIISNLQRNLFSSVRAYVGSSETPEISDARELIVDTVNNAEGGVWIWNYAGHASPSSLGNGVFSTPADVEALTNGANAPLLLALTCHINQFHFPDGDALGPDLVLKADGGAIAVWAPAAPAANLVTQELGEAFYNSMIDEGESVLGQAVLKALSTQEASGHNLNNLLGDPGLRLQ